jgi:dienelactone hydrolase
MRQMRAVMATGLLLLIAACCSPVAPTATPEPASSPTPTEMTPTATAAPPAPTATLARTTPTATYSSTAQIYRDSVLGVHLQYPLGWEAQPGYDLKYAGPDGFFQLSAIDGAGWTLDEVAQNEAHHKMQPYGSDPTIERLEVDGLEACLILPSADQPEAMNGQAGLIVDLPWQIEISGEKYNYLVLWADQQHIRDIAKTLQLMKPVGEALPTATPSEPPPEIQAVLFALAGQFQVSLDDVQLLRWEQVNWPDGCLGIRMRTMCTEAIVPGYRLMVQVAGQDYEYRTDLGGQRLLLAAGPEHGIAEPELVWEGKDDGCQTLLLAADGRAAVGPCDAPLTPLRLLEQGSRPQEWAELLERFSPFEAEWIWGRLVFQGQGEEPASAAWQRAIAFWAQLVRREVQFGRSGASWGMALSWHGEIPDQPGWCRFLQVEGYGWAYASIARCEGGDAQDLGRGWLMDEEMAALDAWLYAKTSLDLPDLIFNGSGAQDFEEDELNALREWAGTLYQRLARLAPASTPTALPTCSPLLQQRACWTTVEVADASGALETVALGYLVYVPEGYGQDNQEGWPLVLFLHGSEERGSNPRVLTKQGLPKVLEQRSDFPFIVVSPQCRQGQWWWPQTHVLSAFLDKIEAEYAVDSKRVYATGLSMGGFGAWALAYQYPDRFAAIAPIAGGYYDGTTLLPADICRMRDVPIWAFHGAKDSLVSPSESERVVDALKACGSDVRFTLYPEAEHTQSWDLAYGDPELYQWFLEHKLE